MSKVTVPYECDCSCHDVGSGIMHCVPCCFPCPHCNKNIERGFMKLHIKKEHPEEISQAENALEN
jgi:hypothetical protein